MRPDPAPIGRSLRHSAANFPERLALVEVETGAELTYGQLAGLAQRLLVLNGGGPGRLTLLSERRLVQAATLAAGLMAGFVVCPINPASTPDAVGRLVRHAQTSLFLSDTPVPGVSDTPRLAEFRTEGLLVPGALGQSPPLPEAASGGLLVYTSGSTGAPKGVFLTERHIGANVEFAVDHFGYGSDWVTGSLLPLFHTFTVMSDLLPMLVVGGSVIITPGFAIARLKATARALADHEVRSYSGVPILFDTMMAMRFPLPPSIRFAIAGAAPLGETTRTRYAEAYGHPILPCYGLTETTCFATVSAPSDIRPSAVGRPAGIEIDIVDDDGRSLPANATGEICFSGPSVLSGGYYADEGKHADEFRRPGWFRTGDVGRVDAEGFVYITGRLKNMLIRGGEKVYLEDVDRCLEAHPSIAQACVVRVGARRHEDEAVAFVVPREADGAKLDTAALNEHVVTTLGPFSRLDDVVVVGELPRSPSGKLLREVLLRSYVNGA
ncbi:AMP-dependent ligase [Deltaproteobacteria bacterium]|nr:AMP-dependent ligase [Deltaproteobacteria bacterium]